MYSYTVNINHSHVTDDRVYVFFFCTVQKLKFQTWWKLGIEHRSCERRESYHCLSQQYIYIETFSYLMVISPSLFYCTCHYYHTSFLSLVTSPVSLLSINLRISKVFDVISLSHDSNLYKVSIVLDVTFWYRNTIDSMIICQKMYV